MRTRKIIKVHETRPTKVLRAKADEIMRAAGFLLAEDEGP